MHDSTSAENHFKIDFSWDSIGWYVASLLGVWGALIGVGEYGWANCFLLGAAGIATFKFGREMKILSPARQTIPFAICVGSTLLVVFLGLWFALYKATQAREAEVRLRQLDTIPALQEQVRPIPTLQQTIDR